MPEADIVGEDLAANAAVHPRKGDIREHRTHENERKADGKDMAKMSGALI